MKQKLENYLSDFDKVVVAYSGGVDSSLLTFAARRVLGRDRVMAMTGDSASVPSADREFVVVFCRKHDISHRFVTTYEQEDPNYQQNPENRCYFCKSELYQRLKTAAADVGYSIILDGTNTTDLKGHRPGYK